MSLAEIFLIGLCLSMDAFAVSIGNGTVMKRRYRCLLFAALCGAMQAVMPMAGYYFGAMFEELISRFDHWIALLALGTIGIKAAAEAVCELRSGSEEQSSLHEPSFAVMMVQSAATSVDALLMGVGLAAVGADILTAAAVIGTVTFLLCLGGGLFGRRLGRRFGAKASVAGGIVLLLIGVKIFAEHTLL